jgi:histidine triad (HIT) family protein
MDCLLCKIIAGEVPSKIVYEDEQTFAFLDIHPVNIGHTLVVPKVHYTNLYDTPDETLAHLISVIKRLSAAIKSAVNADGINIEINNDPAAGQVIMHTHIHIVPRFKGDGFENWRGPRDHSDSEREEVRQKIQSVLAATI